MADMKAKKKTVYDPEVKKAVLEEAARTTIAKAAEQWGVPKGTVGYWNHLRRRRAGEEARAERGVTEEASGGAAVELPKTTAESVKRLKPELPGHARRYSPAEIAVVLEYAVKHGVAAATRDLGPCKETIKFAYSAGRNQTPRRRLKGKTPAQAFEDAAISEEQKAQAREQLRELRRRIEEQEAANRRRCAPALKQLLTDFFTENGLDDPNERYIAQIGSYGIEAALEAMAVFLAKTEAGTLSERNHERYLLGIARNVAYRREDQRTYGHLLDLRAKAGDLVIEPLIKHEKELSATLTPENYRNELLNLALDSSTTVDRFFWRRRFLEVFEALSHAHKQQQGRWCARRIASRSKLPHRERDQFIALLAEAAMPLAA